MLANLKKEVLQVVMVGDFNPAIVQPSWLLYYGLLKEQEAESAKVDVICADATVFEIGDWLKIEVLRDRFVLHSSNEGCYESLRDVLVGVLNLLSHTPLKAIGINKTHTYAYDNNKDINFINKTLINFSSLKEINEQLSFQFNRNDTYDGYIQITCQPQNDTKEIFLSINDHYQLDKTPNALPGSILAIDILSNKWYDSLNTCNTYIEKLYKLMRYE